jgi:inhibitor of KinA sporulation pathway (predicted exonuclease)
VSARKDHDRCLALDLELTCWEGDPPAGKRPQIIQIGIAEIDLVRLTLTRTSSFLVRPYGFHALSDFCTALTGITTEQVKTKGRWIDEVLKALVKEYGPKRKAILTWGDDETALLEEAAPLGYLETFRRMTDLGWIFHSTFQFPQRPGLSDALQFLGLTPVGTDHNAEYDAINTARVFMELMAHTRKMQGSQLPSRTA